MKKPAWGGTVGILLLVLINAGFPQRYVLGSGDVRESFTIALTVMFGVSALTDVLGFSRTVRNASIFIVVGLMSVFNALSLYQLILFMVAPQTGGPPLDGVRLLSSAISIWLTNVLAFALLYWVVDGGGPEHRAANSKGARDFAFPGDAPNPNFADYVFLAFNTATAFSPTDTIPLTTRVRVMMLLESTVSLLALAFAAARAVNILH